MRILVKTSLSPYSGYGQDGLGVVRALTNAGHDVYVQPEHVDAPLPFEVARLLTKRLVAPFDVLVHHTDPGQLGLTPEARSAARVTVGWTMWESTSLVPQLKNVRLLPKKLKSYDLILGYDAVSTEALRPYVRTSKLAVLQGGFWPDEWKAAERSWFSDRFGFAMVGQLHERKDPFVAIQAFQELKTELGREFDGAELHLKTNLPGLHSAMETCIPKLRVHYDVWSQDILYQFYAKQHVLLAPSRGEGKNLPALEFQSTGGAVIATNWGGMTGWLDRSFAYPLRYSLAPVDPQHPECLQARADKDHLKELMLHVFRNRAEVRDKAALAAKVIPQSMSWDSVISRLMDNINAM
jgi:glycosyltransferase involved in cell wall biosynthesis